MYKYREVTEQDFEGISQLIKNKEDLFLVYPNGTYPFTIDQVKEIFHVRKELTVIEDNNLIIGFADFYNFEKGTSAFIGNVIVHESYRAKGLGKQLISKMLKLALEKYCLSEIKISVFNTNTPAILLYSNLGFKPYDIEQKNDPQNTKVALIHMKKYLS